MKTNINQTLKKKLIMSPNPKCNEREFWQLYDRMFGDKNEIIEFLDSTETQKKFELSRKIIRRIAFESNFPPVIELLNYIYNFESAIRYKRSVKHTGRDHYIHLCYLYLLGIYVFFYYPKMNNQLRNSLSLIRFSSGISEESSFVKNFISVWKYFVLYHDIAYQFEYLGTKDHVYLESEQHERDKTGKMFNPKRIEAAIWDEIKLKALATLIAINNTIDDSSSKFTNTLAYLKRNESQFEKISCDVQIDAILQEFKDKKISFMKYVRAGDDIKYYLTFYKYNDFFVILKENSNIKYIIGDNFLFVDKTLVNHALTKKISNDKTLVFSDEWHVQFPNYSIEYYGINLREKIEEFLASEKISIFSNLVSSFKFGLKASLRMKDVVFECYLECCKHLKEEPKSTNDFSELKKICKEELFKVLDKKYAEMESNGVESGEYVYASDFLNSYLNHLKKSLNLERENVDSILNATVNRFNEEYRENKNLMTVYKKISDLVNDQMAEEHGEKEITEEEIFNLYCANGYNEVFKLLSEDDQMYLTHSLQKAVNDENNTVQDILSDYYMEYSEFDHGIAASNVFILHFNYYQKILKDAKNSIFMRMCFNIPNLSNESELEELINKKYVLDYSETIRQVVYAIMVHNLYPENFRNNNYKAMKINSETNPFAYFCMICDALQDWGRPFNINPVEEDYPLFLDSLKVNIKFDNYINVRFMEDNPIIIEKRLKPFSRVLDSYLEGAGDMMRVKFI